MYDPITMDYRGVQSYLTDSLLGMPLSRRSVGEDLYRLFIRLLGQDYKGIIYIEQGRTYLDQIVRVRDIPIMTIRIRKGTGFSHECAYEHDIYGGFRVAMEGLLRGNILSAMLRS